MKRTEFPQYLHFVPQYDQGQIKVQNPEEKVKSLKLLPQTVSLVTCGVVHNVFETQRLVIFYLLSYLCHFSLRKH